MIDSLEIGKSVTRWVRSQIDFLRIYRSYSWRLPYTYFSCIIHRVTPVFCGRHRILYTPCGPICYGPETGVSSVRGFFRYWQETLNKVWPTTSWTKVETVLSCSSPNIECLLSKSKEYLLEGFSFVPTNSQSWPYSTLYSSRSFNGFISYQSKTTITSWLIVHVLFTHDLCVNQPTYLPNYLTRSNHITSGIHFCPLLDLLETGIER